MGGKKQELLEGVERETKKKAKVELLTRAPTRYVEGIHLRLSKNKASKFFCLSFPARAERAL